MWNFLLKIIPLFLFWGIFIFAILQIPYPESLTQANVSQLIYFFIPLYFAITFSLNIFLKNILISFSISLGFLFLLILKALDSFNLVTGVLIIAATTLLVSYFKKNRRGLTNLSKIPKLSSLRRRKR